MKTKQLKLSISEILDQQSLGNVLELFTKIETKSKESFKCNNIMKYKFILLIAVLIFGCSKKEEITNNDNTISSGLYIKTISVTNITQVKGVCNCEILSNNGNPYTMSGIIWGTMTTPTIKSCWNMYDYYKKMDYYGNLSGKYSCTANILYPNTTYYVRAYALNEKDTVYGNIISFKTLPVADFGSVKDYEGNNYRTIKIGNQTWMADNLKSTKYNDGTPIEYLPTNYSSSSSNNKDYYCEYDRSLSNANIYGRLYNGYVVTKKICPTGWHIPTTDEWFTLIKFLGDNYYNTYGDSAVSYNYITSAKALAAVSNLWKCNDDITVGKPIEMNNAAGFSAIPAGLYSYSTKYSSYIFMKKDTIADYWTTNTTYNGFATRGVDARSKNLQSNSYEIHTFAAIRCIKD